jgi:hypothetical protein
LKQSALKIVLLSLRDTWLDLWTVLVCNVVWWIANLLIIPGPPVTLALFYYTNQMVHEETVNVSDFFKAIPRFWSTGWRWGILNLAILFFLVGDLILTSYQSQTRGAVIFSSIYITLILFWALLQVFALPFLLEQEKTSVFQALRNGAVMMGKKPLFSLFFLFLLLLTLTLGTVAFMLSVALGGAFVAFAGNRAVLDQLETK